MVVVELFTYLTPSCKILDSCRLLSLSNGMPLKRPDTSVFSHLERNSYREVSHKTGKKPLGKTWLRRFLAGLNHAFDEHLPVSESLPLTSAEETPQPMLSFADALTPLLLLVGWEGRRAEPSDQLSIIRWLVSVRTALLRLGAGHTASIPSVITLRSDERGGVKVEPQGFLNVLTDGLVGALQRIDVRMLRACEVCHGFFLAPRRKSVTCSPECNNTHRQRRWYESEKKRDELTAQLLSEGKGIRDIAGQLKLPMLKARSYIVRAKGKAHGAS
jgi:hypothetical protein